MDESDVGRLRISANRNLYSTIRDAAGNERGLNVDSSGDIGITNAGLTELAAAINSSKLDIDIASSTVDVMLGTDFSDVLGTGTLITTTQADNLANTLDGLQTTSFLYGFDGSAWDRLKGDSTDGLLVNLGSNNDVSLNAGTNEIGKLAAGVAEIGNVKNSGTFVVQEDGAALTALQKIDDIVHVDDAAFTLGTSSGTMMMGFAGTQSVDANDAAALRCETDGALHIHATSGTIDTITAVTDITNTIDSTISGDALTALQLIDNPVAVLGTATYSEGTTSGNVIGAVRNDALATLANTDNEIAPLQVDANGALFVTTVPNTTHGHAVYLNQDTSAAVEVTDNPASTIYWVHCTNTSAAVAYLNLYDADLDNVTLGSTTPTMQFVVPSQGDTKGAGFTINFGPHGVKFSTGFTVAAATAFDGSTDPGANTVITNIGYST